MLFNDIFFVTLIPFEIIIMTWLIKEIIKEFKKMED